MDCWSSTASSPGLRGGGQGWRAGPVEGAGRQSPRRGVIRHRVLRHDVTKSQLIDCFRESEGSAARAGFAERARRQSPWPHKWHALYHECDVCLRTGSVCASCPWCDMMPALGRPRCAQGWALMLALRTWAPGCRQAGWWCGEQWWLGLRDALTGPTLHRCGGHVTRNSPQNLVG